VLERGDAEGEVEGGVRKGELAHVAADELRQVGLGQVDEHELGDPRRQERREVGGRCVRGADVENPAGVADPRECPRDLDRALVEAGRRLEEPRGSCHAHECVVQRAQLRELGARDELGEERGARHAPVEGGRLRVAAKH